MVRALLLGTKTQTRRAVRARQLRFGTSGEQLWVRETFFAFGNWQTRFNHGKGREEWYFVDQTLALGLAYRYDADGGPGADPHARRSAGAAPAWHKRPALFMPRAASRIALEVVELRRERLQDIGREDALAEGIARRGQGYACADCADGITDDPVRAYRAVWEAINGSGSWDANPEVWMLRFRPLAAA